MRNGVRLAVAAILILMALALLAGCPKSPKPTGATPELEPRVQASGEQPAATSEPEATSESGEKVEGPEAEEAAESPAEEAQETEKSTSGGSTTPVELTDANFKDKVEDAKATALVDFWAVWCPPCRQQGPIVEKIAEKYGDKILVGKVNVDEAEKTAQQFKIEAIPTLILFRDGKEIDRLVGLRDEAELSQAIESKLLK